MLALMAAIGGIGEARPDGLPPLKALTLVPRRVAVQQSIEACHKFAPDARVEKYDRRRGKHQFNYADVIVMTYKGALSAPQATWQSLINSTTLLGLDEVHRGIGEQTGGRLRDFIENGKPTVIAISATPNFSETHTTARALGIERSLRAIAPREAIEIGISNGVQLFALYSGQEVYFSSKRDTITEADAQPLALQPRRNQLIVDVIEDMAKAGYHGLAQCIPGDANTHARHIALLASQRKITDPITKKERKLRVAAVGNKFQSNATNDKIIQAFRQGMLDAITFTRYLTEAFDNPVDYLIAAGLSTSMVDVSQYVGRGARFNKRGITTIFNIVDKYTSRTPKRLWTPFDVLDEECVHNGLVITSKLPNLQPTSPAPSSRAQPKEPRQTTKDVRFFSQAVQEAMKAIPNGTVLDELLMIRGEFDEPPLGYIPLGELPTIQQGLVTVEGARYILGSLTSSDGRPLYVNVRSGKISRYVLPEADNVLAARCNDTSRLISRLEIDAFLMSQGWPRPSFDMFAYACKQSGVTYSITKGTVYVRRADAAKVLLNLASIPLINPEREISLGDLARAIGHSTSSMLQRYVKQKPETYAGHVHTRRKSLPPLPFKITDVIDIEKAGVLLEETRARSPQLAARLGAKSVQQLLAETHAQVKDQFWRRKLRSTLSQAAIHSFVNETIQVKPAMHQASEPPPPPLDESYRLSDHGHAWDEHAACRDSPVQVYGVQNQADIERAKQLCSGCEVKGDCLLFDLRQPSDEIAGGFTMYERRRMGKQVASWLAQSHA